MSYENEAAREEALSKCHSRSAKRIFEALLANGGAQSLYNNKVFLSHMSAYPGIFIKLGQHMSSLWVSYRCMSQGTSAESFSS